MALIGLTKYINPHPSLGSLFTFANYNFDNTNDSYNRLLAVATWAGIAAKWIVSI
jgi:hypothetical protein